MLHKRLIASVLMIGPMLGLFWLDVNRNFGIPGLWLIPLTLVFGLLIAREMIQMFRANTPGVIPWVAFAGTGACLLAVAVPEAFQLPADCPVGRWGWSCVAVFASLCCAFLHEFVYFDGQRSATLRVALSLVTVVYAGWLLSFLLAVRLILGNQPGAIAVLSVLFTTKMSDAGAYFVGKRLGRRKMAPRLSPGKTVEGLVGGVVSAIATAGLFFLLAERLGGIVVQSWVAVFGYGLTLSLVGVFGDLCESLFKRDMNTKDSSGWLPGLGGIMDTADSILFTAPVAFLWWTTGLLGP